MKGDEIDSATVYMGCCNTDEIKRQYDSAYRNFMDDIIPNLPWGGRGTLLNYAQYLNIVKLPQGDLNCDVWSSLLIDYFEAIFCISGDCNKYSCWSPRPAMCYTADCSTAIPATDNINQANSIYRPRKGDSRSTFRKYFSDEPHTWVQVGVRIYDCTDEDWLYFDPMWDSNFWPAPEIKGY